jgi:hypothetical protein
MKNLSLSICLAFAFFVTAAVAQSGTAPGNGQGTTGSSPSMQNGPGSQQPGQPGTTQPDNSTGMGQTDQTNPNQNTSAKGGEKKLKGCVQSQGGQYVLETKHGKSVALTGQDVSAHVGHEVAVKGMWEGGASAGAGVSSSSGGASGAEKTFNVTSVDMISDSCGGKHKGSSGNMGTAPNGTNPSGTGSNAPPQQ